MTLKNRFFKTNFIIIYPHSDNFGLKHFSLKLQTKKF